MKSMKKCVVTKEKISKSIKLDKRRSNRRRSSAGMFYTSSAGAVTSLILILVFSFTFGLIITNNTYAEYTISMTSSGAQVIDVLPGSSGIGTKISSDAVTVSTTCPSGYNLTATTSVNDNKLYLDGSSSASSYFSASDGTTSLGNAANTWGFYQNGSTTPTASSVFKAVPASTSSAATIRTGSSSGTDSFNIYYGVAVGNTLPAGTYTMIQDANNSNTNGSVVYYLTMATSCLPYTVVFNPTSTAGGTTVSGTGTMANQVISAGVATPLNTNTYTAPSGYEFDSWNTAQDGTGTSYTDGQSVTDLTTGNRTITLYAQWTATSTDYTITYNANGGTGSVASQTVTPGSTFTAANNGFSRSGYYFKGWATSSSATTRTYRPAQASITPTSDMTLYAVWGQSSSTSLYDIVKSLTRGNLTATNLAKNPTKNSSGTYTYNKTTFGTPSDAGTNAIYFYRGILDSTVGTYGSDGDGMNWPNYVKLGTGSSATCWRIVRTTGSKGVKMIYNGLYGATTSGSCANATTNAQVATKVFNSGGGTRSIVGVGYTLNGTYASTSATTATAYSTIFGNNSNYAGNSTDSKIKDYIENTWFSNISSYESKLESNAGYCNDRTLNEGTSWTDPVSDSTTIVPYGTSGMTEYYFGSYIRNKSATKTPSLTCPRATADLYSTSSASAGNKQLKKPVALLTADESSFAGSGSSTASQGGPDYHKNSYLHSGSTFWLLSPNTRTSIGYAIGFHLYSGGDLGGNRVNSADGVRPAISLTSGTTPASGSGTATDPWIVNP